MDFFRFSIYEIISFPSMHKFHSWLNVWLYIHWAKVQIGSKSVLLGQRPAVVGFSGGCLVLLPSQLMLILNLSPSRFSLYPACILSHLCVYMFFCGFQIPLWSSLLGTCDYIWTHLDNQDCLLISKPYITSFTRQYSVHSIQVLLLTVSLIHYPSPLPKA